MTGLPSNDELRQIREGFVNHADFCAKSLTIRNEQGETVPLILSPAQAKQQESVRRQEKLGRPIRQVALKARRVRWSVGSCTQIFKRVAFLPGQTALVMGHQEASTANLFDFFKQFIESYKPYHGIRMLPVRSVQDGRKIEWGGGSKVIFHTAGSPEAGRSGNYRHVLFDEYAFYRDAATLMRAALNTVPKDPMTSVFVVSTANGLGGPYYELWQQANDPQAGTAWAAEFFGWWEEPRYALPLEEPVHLFERSLTPAETELRRMYRLSLEQLQWRRWKIANDCAGSEDSFDQEYPHSPRVAFLTSGRPRFDLRAVERVLSVTGGQSGDLSVERVGLRTVPVFLERQDGLGVLRVWRRPERGRTYVCGADPSKGIDVGVGQGKQDPDYSVATVFDALTWEQVAIVRARITPYAFAEYCTALCNWYNSAFLVPEANELGFIEGLLEHQFPVQRLYVRRREADDLRAPNVQEIGFLTTGTSKLELISRLDGALREGAITLHCAITAQELRTFVYLPNSKAQGQPGCHDDCVIATALAVLGLLAAPRVAARIHSPGQLRVERYGKHRGRIGYAGEDEDS